MTRSPTCTPSTRACPSYRSPKSAATAKFRELADAVLGKAVVPVTASTNGTDPAPKKERRGLFGRR